jgi:CPA2 family monovalent cation:H+ antiporter-2
MLVDPGLFLRKPLETLLLVAAFVLGKGLVSSLAAVAMRFPSRVAWLSGVGLAQFGEFGFVLATLAHQLKILGPHELDLLIAAGVFSMFVTPFAMATAPHVTAGEKILQPLERLLGVRGIDEPAAEHRNLSGHVVIAGFGVGGRLLAEALRTHGIPYLVLELNAEKVRAARAGGEPIYYGDITSPEAMQHAGVERARALVVLINDPAAARRAVAAVRAYAPMTAVFIRARYFTDRPDLHRIGADQVVVEELEAALEVTARVLRHSGVEQTSIGKQIRTARAEAESEPPQP